MKAFIFDLNGTIIDDMKFHTDAWFEIINDKLKKGLSRQEVKNEMYGKNREVLERIFGKGHFSDEEIDDLSAEKEKIYQEEFKPHLKLIKGLDEYLEKASEKGIKMAVATAAITANVDFVLDGLNLRRYFQVKVTADEVEKSKPDPQTFLLAAQHLKVKPEDCIVFEDNPKGVEAALNGGMKSVVITTMHDKEDFEGLTNIVAFISDYTDPFLEKLLKLV